MDDTIKWIPVGKWVVAEVDGALYARLPNAEPCLLAPKTWGEYADYVEWKEQMQQRISCPPEERDTKIAKDFERGMNSLRGYIKSEGSPWLDP